VKRVRSRCWCKNEPAGFTAAVAATKAWALGKSGVFGGHNTVAPFSSLEHVLIMPVEIIFLWPFIGAFR